MKFDLRTIGIGIAGIGLAVLLALYLITAADLRACKAGRAADRAAYTAAQADVARKHAEQKAADEARYARITKEKDVEIAAAHDANRDIAAKWMREQAARRATSRAYLPLPTDAPGKPDKTSAEAIIPPEDVLKCADAFTVAEGWQAWWLSISSQEPR